MNLLVLVLASIFAQTVGLTRITVDFTDKIYVSKTTTTLQVGSHRRLSISFILTCRSCQTRSSIAPLKARPAHSRTQFMIMRGHLLRRLRLPYPRARRDSHSQADFVRYVPWFPYPHVAVAELDAPVSL